MCALGKMLLVFFPVLLALHLWLAASFDTLEESVQVGENIRNELMGNQASLTTKREQMLSPERVRGIAAEKLALYVPEKEQVTFIK